MEDKLREIEPKIVKLMPKKLQEGILYISLENQVAIHLCACGCKEKVVTPLEPALGWQLNITNKGVSLYPSIGNFQQKCNTHYYIRDNKIIWL